ncbi:mycofactocin biosynthesis glycosyltransferase MftF [Chloroflexota bacterium]
MEGFGFTLADNTYLREDPDGYFLLSKLPLRILRINKPLFQLLKHLQEGGGLSEFISQNPGLEEGRWLRVLLSLVSKGYLKLERIAELEDYPKVSIVIPVRDQPRDIIECIQSLANLNYPEDKFEVIVVDDGSRNNLSDVVSSFNVRVIRLDESQGASVCRNIGAENACGDILAFLDADCMADKNWLREIIPFFKTATVGAVGGYVDGYYRDSYLDRYEEVSSSLNMGKRFLLEGDTESNFYVPSCNILITRQAFMATGGFKSGMRVGEDVDFCWRMRKLGYTLLYIPFGRVAHKHRNKLFKMLKRRSDYGTSEALLYLSHRDKRKTFLISIYAGLSFLALTLSILLLNPYPIYLILLLFGLDLFRKSRTLKKFKMVLPLRQIAYAVLRSYFSFYYFTLFHLVRYYLVLMCGLGFLVHSIWFFVGLAILFTSIVDYYVKRPNLPYSVFLILYVLEHLAYQLGVFWGCLKLRDFRAYIPVFSYA